MLTPRIALNLTVALALAFFMGSARAFSLGPGGAISDESDALYALNPDGREVKIAQTGSAFPIGLPSRISGCLRWRRMAQFCSARQEP